MGGRKKTFKVLKKPKLQKPKQQFDCGVCGWKDSIMIKIKKGFKVAKLECERCETTFQIKVRSLDEPIDVYHDWLHKIKTKAIKPYPSRLEDDYDLSSEEENCNDVEKYLKPNYKSKQSKRKRIKKNSIEEDEESVSSSQIEVDDDVSEDSLILKQKIEAKYKKTKKEIIDDEDEDEVEEQQEQQKQQQDESEDEEEKQSSQEYEDSKDESFDVKKENKKNKKPKSKKKK